MSGGRFITEMDVGPLRGRLAAGMHPWRKWSCPLGAKQKNNASRRGSFIGERVGPTEHLEEHTQTRTYHILWEAIFDKLLLKYQAIFDKFKTDRSAVRNTAD